MAPRRGADRGAGHAHAVRETATRGPRVRHRGRGRGYRPRRARPAAGVRLASRAPVRRAPRRVAAPAAALNLAADRSGPPRRPQRDHVGAAARLARCVHRPRGHTQRRCGRPPTPLARHLGRSAASRTRSAPRRAGPLAHAVRRLAHLLRSRSPRRTGSRGDDASGVARARRRRRSARLDRRPPALCGLARSLHAEPHPGAGHRLGRPSRRGQAARTGTPSGGRGRSALGRSDNHRGDRPVRPLPRRSQPRAGHRLGRPSRRGWAARSGTPGGDRGSGYPRLRPDRCSNRHPRSGRRRSRPQTSHRPPALRQLGRHRWRHSSRRVGAPRGRARVCRGAARALAASGHRGLRTPCSLRDYCTAALAGRLRHRSDDGSGAARPAAGRCERHPPAPHEVPGGAEVGGGPATPSQPVGRPRCRPPVPANGPHADVGSGRWSAGGPVTSCRTTRTLRS